MFLQQSGECSWCNTKGVEDRIFEFTFRYAVNFAGEFDEIADM